tara:strand:+ start:157 stop:753 length:597 start_codon:yes stop_codon:yes gene_type:complete
MKAQEVLKKAKELLSIETEVEKVEMAQATLENGTVIEAESMAEGQEVFIVTEDEKVALPVGDYTLEDGTILKVEEEGIIASIGEAEAETEEPAEEELAEEEEMGYATKEELAEVKSMIEEIKAMIGEKEEMSSEEVETPAEVEELSEVEEKVEELSAVEKINHNPEAETERQVNLFANKAPQTTMDRVLRQVSKFKNA